MDEQHKMSVRCFYENGDNYTQHYPEIKIDEIPLWVKAYWYTHPTLEAVSIKVWTKD